MGKKKDKARAKAGDDAPKLPKRIAGVKLPKELRKDKDGNDDERGLGGRVRRLDWQG